ncbi:MAG: alpha/beta hydrolase [Pseudomonadota bacterium]
MCPTVIFVHGMWSLPGVWDGWMRRFETRGYACVAIALPGHGDNLPDCALNGIGMADYAAAVERVALACDHPVLIGHSLGGLIAQQASTRLALSAAVLVNSAVPAPVFPLRPIMLPGLTRHFLKWGLWRGSFRLSRREANHLLFNALSRDQQDACYEHLTAESGRVAYELGFGRLNWTGSNRVDRQAISCPLLALSGVRDRIVPIGASRRMSAWYGKRIDFREYAGHAHWILSEQDWTARADEVLEWLDQAVPSGARRSTCIDPRSICKRENYAEEICTGR